MTRGHCASHINTNTRSRHFRSSGSACVSERTKLIVRLLCGSVGRGHQCPHRGGRGTAVPAVQTAGHDPDQPGPPQQPGEGRSITVTSCTYMLYRWNICIYLHVFTFCIYMLYCRYNMVPLYLLTCVHIYIYVYVYIYMYICMLYCIDVCFTV